MERSHAGTAHEGLSPVERIHTGEGKSVARKE